MTMDFSTADFKWDKMLNVYDKGNYSDENAVAVASLMKTCGYSVEMNYGLESGAITSNVAGALKTYFGYDAGTRFHLRAYYGIDAWEEMLYNNLKSTGPIQYSGRNDSGGHSFIVDGYAGNGYFHLNWGWGGMSDGNFLITALDPQSQGLGGSMAGYNQRQGAVLGAKPSDGSTLPEPPFQLAITQAMSPDVADGKLTVIGAFGNNGGAAQSIIVAMQFCDYNTGEVVATATCLNVSDWPANIGLGFRQISASIPPDLAAGTYKVYPVSSTDRGATYSRAIAPIGEADYVILSKQADGTCKTETGESASIEITDFELKTQVYAGTPFEIAAKAVNNSDSEVIKEINLGFLNSDMELVAVGPTVVVGLRKDETMELPSAITLIRGRIVAGDTYQMAYVDMNTMKVLNTPIQITVRTQPEAAVLSMASGAFSIADADAVTLDNIRINYSIYCNSGFYSSPLLIQIFNEDLSGSSLDNLTTPICFIEAGSWAHATNLKLGVPTGLNAGMRYAAAVYYIGSELGRLGDPAFFTVASAGSGIGEVTATGPDGSVKGSLTGETLHVTADSDISSIEVYSLSGQLVAASASSTIDLSGSAKGVYAVKVMTAKGTATIKLIK